MFYSRIREVAKDDLVGLHLRLWRSLWTLSWDQLCVSCWDSLLVLNQALQEALIWEHETIFVICHVYSFNVLMYNILSHILMVSCFLVSSWDQFWVCYWPPPRWTWWLIYMRTHLHDGTIARPIYMIDFFYKMCVLAPHHIPPLQTHYIHMHRVTPKLIAMHHTLGLNVGKCNMCGLMERAWNFDSETHVKKWILTSWAEVRQNPQKVTVHFDCVCIFLRILLNQNTALLSLVTWAMSVSQFVS